MNEAKELEVNDAIRCASKDDLLNVFTDLEKNDYKTEFEYFDEDGNEGYFIRIIGRYV